jgi:hypothetical protein
MEETDEYIKKRMQSYERNMQKSCDSLKRPSLQSMGMKKKRCKPKAKETYSTK